MHAHPSFGAAPTVMTKEAKAEREHQVAIIAGKLLKNFPGA